MKISDKRIKSAALDHLGIVSGACNELRLASRIDQRIEKGRSDRVMSCGKSVLAMIINGLGFTNRRLYLTAQYFASKPTSLLLGEGIEAKDVTDAALGRGLDEISEYGCSKLFAELAFDMAIEHGLLGNTQHLDSTSLSVHGNYRESENSATEEGIKINHGYSKDKRADLKQVVLNLVVNGPAELPLWMESLDGNSSDKTSFPKTLERVRAFEEQLKLSSSRWVADAAFYTAENLLAVRDCSWISRVPANISEAENLLDLSATEIDWTQSTVEGYSYAVFKTAYAGINQRWLLVFSEKAYSREVKTLERKLLRQELALKRELWHMSNKQFDCEVDASKAVIAIEKKYPLFKITVDIIKKTQYEKRGRPGKNAKRQAIYQLLLKFEKDEPAITSILNSRGRFILATNELDEQILANEVILDEYKDQQKAERGFRFIKNPDFMVNSIFLKKPSRIQALMMVMSLCLFVYNFAQHKFRSALKDNNTSIPNQKGKAIQNPTLRWVFQIMEGIAIVTINKSQTKQVLVTNMTELRIKIVSLFGPIIAAKYAINSNYSGIP